MKKNARIFGDRRCCFSIILAIIVAGCLFAINPAVAQADDTQHKVILYVPEQDSEINTQFTVVVENASDESAYVNVSAYDETGNLRNLLPVFVEANGFSEISGDSFSADAKMLTVESNVAISAYVGISDDNDVYSSRRSRGIRSGQVTDQVTSFIHPLENPTAPAGTCYVGGACVGSATDLHVARDYGVGYSTTTSAYSVNFGTLRQDINYNQNIGCNSLSCNMGNIIVIEHLLTTGEKWLSLYAHLSSKNLNGASIQARIANKQKIGIVGCSGSTIEAWCSTAGSNRHVHLELKKPDMGTSDLYPYAYMNQTEANTLATQFKLGANLTISQVVNSLFSDISTFQAQNRRVMIPYFSNSIQIPTSANYDVYGKSGQPLYAAITVRPSLQTTFYNIGVGGRDASGNVTDLFIQPNATLNSTSAALSGNRVFQCTDPNGCDYKFYAYIESNGTTNIGGGYPLKATVLPNDGKSEIVDNDSRSSFQYGGEVSGVENFHGYYLSSSLFQGGGSTRWAKWLPSNSGRYRVFVHIPSRVPNAASSVTYKIYSSSGGSAIITDPISHIYQSDTMGTWLQLKSGAITEWDFNAGGYVGLSVENISANNFVAADAVKFIYVGNSLPTLTVINAGGGTVASYPTGISCGTTCSKSYLSGTSVTLTASPSSGYTFAGWGGGFCSGTGACTVTMNASKTVTATFNANPTKYTLSVGKSGSGSGTVTGSGISCGSSCQNAYTSGTSVTLTASPSSGSTFAGWSACSGTGSCTVTMNAAKTVTATFNAAIPSSPSISTISANGPTSIAVAWNSVSGASMYGLWRSTSASGSYQQISCSSTTSYTDSGSHLSPGTTYYYKVKAGNSTASCQNGGTTGWSSFSSYRSATTQIDSAPYFSGASLGTSVSRPNKIYFSGYAKDDTGLKVITMKVSGPKGNDITAFTENISGTSKSLSSYYFSSSNSTYANIAGYYTVTLYIKDTRDQLNYVRFNVTVK